MEPTNRQIWVEYIRVVATFCVVILHTSAPLLTKYNMLPKSHWMIGNIFDSSARMSVPIFFMLSGYLLLEKDEPLNIFFKKRFNKVGIPLIVWSLIYIPWNDYYREWPKISIYELYEIVLTPTYYHLWFLYAIIGIYLIMPILRVVVQQSSKSLLYYYILIWFLAASIIPTVEKITGVMSRIDLLAISGFSGYLVLGLLLGKIQLTKRSAVAAGFLSVGCVIITITGTYLLIVRNNGIFSNNYYDYLSPQIVISSVTIFVLIKYIVVNVRAFSNERLLSIIESISFASLGIYLIHPIFIDLLGYGYLGFTLNCYQKHPIFIVPLTAATTFVLSYVSVTILRQIPIVRKITP
ncbi:MAG TPA: acyltransferase family protein [Nitrospiria bacterium]|nr:acyltransferase family protein [Nitrospiria bacterium]